MSPCLSFSFGFSSWSFIFFFVLVWGEVKITQYNVIQLKLRHQTDKEKQEDDCRWLLKFRSIFHNKKRSPWKNVCYPNLTRIKKKSVHQLILVSLSGQLVSQQPHLPLQANRSDGSTSFTRSFVRLNDYYFCLSHSKNKEKEEKN